MKKVLALILCIITILSCMSVGVSAIDTAPVYYIDSINGDDNNSGRSPSDAWKTIYNDGYEFVPGTKVLFRAGGAYDLTDVNLTVEGTKENPIVISSYGEGERPLLYTNEREEVFTLMDCSYVTISNVQITAPNGGGIWINTKNKTSEGIVIDNVKFFGIQNYEVNGRDNLSHGPVYARACIVIKGLYTPEPSIYPVNNLTISNCEMVDCANGISAWGMTQNNPDKDDEYNAYYNEGLLIENCYFSDMDAEAIIIGICDGAVVRNCVSTRCCQGAPEPDEKGNVKYFTAAIWFWGSINSIVEHCEISDQKNYGDGMAVDFDSYSNYCTYQYVYSHDNQRFIMNNAKKFRQKGNTVRYCLSVNDGVGSNRMAGGTGEENFSFYNNTVVNCGFWDYSNLYNSFIANNIIIPKYGEDFYCDIEDITGNGNTFENNCYYNAITPLCDITAMNEWPAFAGDDYSDKNSFKLAKNSPLIGEGTIINDGLTEDLFGEEIVSNNIGCYGGEGVDVEGDRSNIFEEIINFFKVVIGLIKTQINDLIEDIEYLKNNGTDL